MRDFIKMIAGILFIIVFLTAVSWGLAISDIAFQSTFGVKKANVQYEVFKETQQFNEGMIMQLQNFEVQYAQADESGKDTIASVVISRYAAYDYSKLSPQLRQFVQACRQRQGLK